jgi:outer membrane protein OmpA-like peptidoglycan-associated protein
VRKLTYLGIALLMAAFLGSAAWAQFDLTKSIGVGVKGPFWAPLMAGSKVDSEPYLMGLLGGVQFKYGLNENFMVGVSGGYGLTYDDTTGTDDKGFSFYSKDNASVKLTGIFTDVTAWYYFMPESKIRPFLLAGAGINFMKAKTEPGGVEVATYSDFVGKGGAGVEFFVAERIGINVGARFNYLIFYVSTPSGWTDDQKKADYRAYQAYLEPSVNFTYYLGGGKDTDKDGVKDDMDMCPDTPMGAMVDMNGCPLDEDGDGVYDGLDQCPNTPRGAKVDVNGCPIDSDKDGVYDGIDRCPNTPSGVKVDRSGCPLDEDNDGVPDYKDKCAGTPQGAKVDMNGCPIDSDNDGVADGIDSCPGTPAGTPVDEKGCPLAKPIEKPLVLHIEYAIRSVEPDAAAKTKLDDLAARMKVYADVRIDINGYTDALGSTTLNKQLSQRRADAIKKYLEGKGISSARMTATGYGETNFLDPANKNSKTNRRVEIVPRR